MSQPELNAVGTLHTCHARNCNVAVPRKMFMCKKHWFMLPKSLREEIWAQYLPGQEEGRVSPTEEYLAVTDVAIGFIAKKER